MSMVYLFQNDRIQYPKAAFHPDCAYPEYPFGGDTVPNNQYKDEAGGVHFLERWKLKPHDTWKKIGIYWKGCHMYDACSFDVHL